MSPKRHRRNAVQNIHHPSSATFFFHERVITVLQLGRGKRLVGKKKEDEVWFDFIDSLGGDRDSAQ
jgi:hypothetical protein